MAEQNPKHRRKPDGIGRIEGRITADGLTHGDRSPARGHGQRTVTSSTRAARARRGASAAWSAASSPRSALRRRSGSARYFPTARSTPIATQGQAPEFTATFRTARAALRVLAFGPVGLLESYFDGNLDIEGNFPLAFRAALDAGFDNSHNALVALRNRWHEFRFSNKSIAQAKANARFHYGLGEAFYKLWLDRVGMMYTCAYWKEGTKTLEEAQQNKMDHVCRKVQLKRGETFVDVGCGWGGLLFHAWERYGALGTGINATTEQVAELRAELARRGLG